MVVIDISISLKNHLKNYCVLLQLRDRPLFPKDLFNDFEEVRSRKKTRVVLLEVLDEVVQDEKSACKGFLLETDSEG